MKVLDSAGKELRVGDRVRFKRAVGDGEVIWIVEAGVPTRTRALVKRPPGLGNSMLFWADENHQFPDLLRVENPVREATTNA